MHIAQCALHQEAGKFALMVIYQASRKQYEPVTDLFAMAFFRSGRKVTRKSHGGQQYFRQAYLSHHQIFIWICLSFRVCQTQILRRQCCQQYLSTNIAIGTV